MPVGPQWVEACARDGDDHTSSLRSTRWTDCCDLETRLEGHPRRHCCKAFSRYPGAWNGHGLLWWSRCSPLKPDVQACTGLSRHCSRPRSKAHHRQSHRTICGIQATAAQLQRGAQSSRVERWIDTRQQWSVARCIGEGGSYRRRAHRRLRQGHRCIRISPSARTCRCIEAGKAWSQTCEARVLKHHLDVAGRGHRARYPGDQYIGACQSTQPRANKDEDSATSQRSKQSRHLFDHRLHRDDRSL
mmetsp:Transcript_81719/g.195994  ORF Transcript_81719/g.195994 Transcript_81719/m.195994 type:complete len:245 (-) Transcript_81719:3-737(-)